MKIAVIFPSRGLVFSKTADELLQNLQGYDYDIYFAHGLPIPQCFEKPLQRALRGSYSHIWLVEDDMVLPKGTLDTMLKEDVPVVTLEYPVSKDGQGTVFKSKEGAVLFCGTGCLLVKRDVFDKLKAPYFRTDIRWNVMNYGKFIRFTANKSKQEAAYGLHDVTFGLKLWQAGIPIGVVSTTGQRKLVALGKAGSNDGAHQIEEWTTLKPDVLLKRYFKMPAMPVGKLITVQTVSGQLNVHPTKAKKLIKAGVATAIPHQSVSIDYNGVLI